MQTDTSAKRLGLQEALESLSVIHVAGTKGKASCAKFVSQAQPSR